LGHIHISTAASGHAVRAGQSQIRLLLDTLERECSAYCVLAGYDLLPEATLSDIDFMVPDADLARLPGILAGAAAASGMALVQSLEHEITACYYVLAAVDGPTVTFLHPDASGDYRRRGRLLMRADDVLARRRRHPRGFWIPSAQDGFAYYLMKRIDKQLFDSGHGGYLSRLYAETPTACRAALRRLWPASSAELIARAAESNCWQHVMDALPRLARELHSYAPRQARWRDVPSELARRVRRVLYPTGITVACIGPDGVGKSTIIDALESGLRLGFRRTARFHTRPTLLKGTSASRQFTPDPHGRTNRGVLPSMAKVFYFAADYLLGYWTHVRPMLVRSTLVIFDRYFFDLFVDQRRFRYGGPAWLVRCMARIIPRPDVILLLSAPAATVHARKQELSIAEIERQLREYLRLAANPRLRIRSINAARPVDEVISDCYREILTYMEERTRRRLRLQVPAKPDANRR
jgi:thymidylate kinase